MKRSEHLAKEGKVEVYYCGLLTAKVITDDERCKNASKLRYLATDLDVLYDGKEATADIYESRDNDEIFAVVNVWENGSPKGWCSE